jgi:hypothetical protein
LRINHWVLAGPREDQDGRRCPPRGGLGDGCIGSIAIRAIQRRPDLDLVGVWMHSHEKVGEDAGELADGEPTGLAATNDADALIALKPDCVIYAASGPERNALAIPDYVKAPRSRNQRRHHQRHAVDQSARLPTHGVARPTGRRGQAGPGVPVCGGDRARLRRRPPTPAAVHPVVVDREDSRVRDRPVRRLRAAIGTVEAATCGALRMRAIGVVDGREAIVIEHVTLLAHDVGPDWPTGIGDLSYLVTITADPYIDCTTAATLKDPHKAGIAGMTSGAGAMVATAGARGQRRAVRRWRGARTAQLGGAPPTIPKRALAT